MLRRYHTWGITVSKRGLSRHDQRRVEEVEHIECVFGRTCSLRALSGFWWQLAPTSSDSRAVLALAEAVEGAG
jgi:hypothetical protein